MMNLADALLGLVLLAEKTDTRLKLEYDTGRFVSGRDMMINEAGEYAPDPEHVQQGRRGWRVEVNQYAYQDDNGEEMLYGKLDNAIAAGLEILRDKATNSPPPHTEEINP